MVTITGLLLRCLMIIFFLVVVLSLLLIICCVVMLRQFLHVNCLFLRFVCQVLRYMYNLLKLYIPDALALQDD